MSRTFKETVEIRAIFDEYYRCTATGLVATLDEIHRVRTQRSLEGDYTTRYIVTFKDGDRTEAVYGAEFLNGDWQTISREEYLTDGTIMNDIMTQKQIDAALDRETFLDCHSTIRSWLHYQHSLGRKAVLTPKAKWYSELLDEQGNFYAMLCQYRYDYFCSL